MRNQTKKGVVVQEPAGCPSTALLHCSPVHLAIPGKAQCLILGARLSIKKQSWPQSEAATTRKTLGPAFLQRAMAGRTQRVLNVCQLQPLTQLGTEEQGAITGIINGHFRSQRHWHFEGEDYKNSRDRQTTPCLVWSPHLTPPFFF